jgi:DNA-directed RNA polymerase specialized sigma24 family protein
MNDSSERQLLHRAERGDQAAFAAFCAEHVDTVYDFAVAVLGGAEVAGAVAAATFASAAANVHPLAIAPAPRVWLLADARRRCLNDEEPIATSLEAPLDPAVVSAPLSDDELLDAARALGSSRHTLLDLRLRQRLAPAEMAAAAGVSAENAGVLEARLLETAGEDLRANLLRRRCASLHTILLRGEEADLRQRSRDVAQAHVERCARCSTLARQLGDPLARYAAVPAVAAPSATRAAVLKSVLQNWQAGGEGESAGGHVRASHAPPLTSSRLLLAFAPLAAIASALGALLLLPASPLALTRDRHLVAAASPAPGEPDTVVTAPSPTPTAIIRTVPATASAGASRAATSAAAAAATAPTALPSSTRPASATPSPTVPTTPSQTPSPTIAPTATPTAVDTPAPTPTLPPPSPTATTCIGSIQANVTKVTLLPGVRSSFVLFNTSECSPASFTITVAPPVSWLQLETRSGTIPALRSVTVFLLGDPLSPSHTTLQIAGPNGSFTLEIETK